MNKLLTFQNPITSESDVLVINGEVSLYNQSRYQIEVGQKINQTNNMFDYGKIIKITRTNTSPSLHIYIRWDKGLVFQSNFLDVDEDRRRIAFSFYHSLFALNEKYDIKNIFQKQYLNTFIEEVVNDLLHYCKIADKTPQKEDIDALRCVLLWYYRILFPFEKMLRNK